MDYKAHYDRLIERARSRVLEGYVERHHIVPRCLGGGDELDNIVSLTPEEHYTAHQLLCKIYPDHTGLVFAAIMMTSTSAKTRRSNKLYGWLKRKLSKKRGPYKKSTKPRKPRKKETKPRNRIYIVSEEQKAKVSATLKGRVHSPEAIAKMSASQKGKPRGYPNGMLGRKHSDETRRRISEGRQRQIQSSYSNLE